MSAVPFIENLKDSSNKSMAVDGSSVNKTYSYSPGSGTVVIVGLICVLEDSGQSSLTKFGSITALTNGCVISVTINSITTTITTIKDNADLITRFPQNHFGSSATDTLGGAVGFGDSYDTFVGQVEFPRAIILTGSDSIQAVVKDNLTNISTLQISCIIDRDV